MDAGFSHLLNGAYAYSSEFREMLTDYCLGLNTPIGYQSTNWYKKPLVWTHTYTFQFKGDSSIQETAQVAECIGLDRCIMHALSTIAGFLKQCGLKRGTFLPSSLSEINTEEGWSETVTNKIKSKIINYVTKLI